MSSLPPNPNPNSNSNPAQKPTKMKRKRKNSKKMRNPNWLDLPEDVWFMILSKLKTIDIIENAQKVCMLFRKLCNQPAMFNTIDMFLPDAYMDLPYNVNSMTRFAVDRSAGGLLDITLEVIVDDDTFMYIVDRSKNLKRLRLENLSNLSVGGLIEAIKKLPMLEELQLILCEFLGETVEALGHTCPSLRSFSLTTVGYKTREVAGIGNGKARAIAKSMPQLRHLQIIGNNMTNEGLKAILDGCPLLESLDLRACFHIDLSGDLGKRCERIKRVRYPNDSTKDYGWHACGEDFPYAEWRNEGGYQGDGWNLGFFDLGYF